MSTLIDLRKPQLQSIDTDGFQNLLVDRSKLVIDKDFSNLLKIFHVFGFLVCNSNRLLGGRLWPLRPNHGLWSRSPDCLRWTRLSPMAPILAPLSHVATIVSRGQGHGPR